MGRRKITDDGRANIIAFAILAGYPNRRGSQDYVLKKVTGQKLDYRTLKRWYLTVNLDLIEKKIMELKSLVEIELEEVFKEMGEKRKDASYRDLTVAAGIMSDKLIVLQGGVTNRSETISGNWKDIVESARTEGKQKPFKPDIELKEHEIGISTDGKNGGGLPA